MRIIHVFRAPVGGLMRHVRDLAVAQSEMGHDVGMVCADDQFGSMAERELCALEPNCALGVERIPISRLPAFDDLSAYLRFRRTVGRLKPDIVHGHGAKGGALARLAARHGGARAFYTPHGGSLNFDRLSLGGFFYFTIEKLLMPLTAGLLFVCEWERRCFDDKIGITFVPNRVTFNGLRPQDFNPVEPKSEASDILFIGELRPIKNVDVLLHAIAAIRKTRRITATIVGDGPERAELHASCAALGLRDCVQFIGTRPAAEMLSAGRVMVVPSRLESMPYVILEAIAAGIPVIATAVGGIPEILPGDQLVAPNDAAALAHAIVRALDEFPLFRQRARGIAERAKTRFPVSEMSERITAFYGDAAQPQARNNKRDL